jgi:hypothetical protein
MINLRIDRVGLQLRRVIEVRFESKNRQIRRGDPQLFSDLLAGDGKQPSRNGEVERLRTAFLLRLWSLRCGNAPKLFGDPAYATSNVLWI